VKITPRATVAAAMAGAWLVAGQAAAQPRMASEAATIEQVETPPTDVWLQRLPGRYVFDGVIHHVEIADYDPRDDYPDGQVMGVSQYLNEWSQPVVGRGDCIEFAEAPGLQCVVNILWPEMWDALTGRASLGAVSDLSPAMVLAGINPQDQAIRFLLVDKRGLGHPGSLALKGETATAKVSCVNMPGVLRCEQKFTITARAESNLIFVTLSTALRYQRSKTDRKQFLDRIGGDEGPLEKPREWLDELLEVSFSLRRDRPVVDLSKLQQPAEIAPATAPGSP
jgi:hypothetical protein